MDNTKEELRLLLEKNINDLSHTCGYYKLRKARSHMTQAEAKSMRETIKKQAENFLNLMKQDAGDIPEPAKLEYKQSEE